MPMSFVLPPSPSTGDRLLVVCFFPPFRPPPPPTLLGKKKALRYSPIPLLEAGRDWREGFPFFRWNGIDLRGWGEEGGWGLRGNIWLHRLVEPHASTVPAVLYSVYVYIPSSVDSSFVAEPYSVQHTAGGGGCVSTTCFSLFVKSAGRHFGHTCISEFLREFFRVYSFFARFATLSYSREKSREINSFAFYFWTHCTTFYPPFLLFLSVCALL